MNTISLIVAMDRNYLIGKDDDLPWKRDLPADLNRFKKKTIGKPVIMGRETYETLPDFAKPLSKRKNIIMTRNKDFKAEGCHVVHSKEEALECAGDVQEIMIIGGAEIYNIFMDQADFIYLTLVHESFEGDTYFPRKINEKYWDCISYKDHEPDEENKYPYTFQTLRRKDRA